MAGPEEFDGSEPETPASRSRGRWILQVAIVVALIISMVFLAFVSGRGVVTVRPENVPNATATTTANATPDTDLRLAVVDADGQLQTMDAAGGSATTVGGSGIRFTFPAWSPDGTRIAAIGQTAAETGVYIFAVDRSGAASTEPAVVYRSADELPFYLYWAPDSRRVTFLTSEPDGLALRIAPADASSPAVSIRQGSPLYWAWAAPDRLFVHSGVEGVDGFYGEVGLDGTTLEPSTVTAGAFRAPAVTGNGRFRAFSSPGTGTPEQVIVERTDRTNRHVAGVDGAAALDFGPAGDELAFLAPAAAGPATSLPVGPLRLMDPASGAIRTLLPDPVVAFYWSPDGSTIAALEAASPGDNSVASTGAVVLARAGDEAREVPAATVPGLALRLVFVRVEGGAIRSQRVVRLSDAFASQLLPYFDQYALSHLVWSPDGASIVLPLVSEDGLVHLTALRADGSQARPIVDAAMGFWRP
jgi:TolB protein